MAEKKKATSKAKKSSKSSVSKRQAAPAASRGVWSAQKTAFVNGWKHLSTGAFWGAGIMDLFLLLFLIVIYAVAGRLVFNILQPILPNMLDVGAMKLMENPAYEDAFVQIAPQVYSAIWSSLIIIFASAVLAVLAFTFHNGSSWSMVTKRKFTPIMFRKMFIINLIWFTFWLIIGTIGLLFLDGILVTLFEVVYIALLFSADHVLRATASEGKGMFRTMRDSVWLCIKKAHWFIMLIAVILITSLVLFLLVGYLSMLAAWLEYILIPLLIVLILGFSRVYVLELLKELNPN